MRPTSISSLSHSTWYAGVRFPPCHRLWLRIANPSDLFSCIPSTLYSPGRVSFSLHQTITDVFSQPQTTFVEAFNAEGEKRVVRRDASLLPTSESILAKFEDEVGDRLFAKVMESNQTDIPPFDNLNPFDVTEILSGINQILAFMYLRGYCLKEPASTVKDRLVTIEFVGPIVLWSTQALSQLHAIPNDYDIMAIRSFLRQYSWTLAGEPRTTTSDSVLRRTFTIKPI